MQLTDTQLLYYTNLSKPSFLKVSYYAEENDLGFYNDLEHLVNLGLLKKEKAAWARGWLYSAVEHKPKHQKGTPRQYA